MSGIQYLTDEHSARVAVQIDLKKYAKLWEDFEDAMLIEQRLKERPRVSLEDVERRYASKRKK